MHSPITISATSLPLLKQQLQTLMKYDEVLYTLDAIIAYNNTKVFLNIDIDPGGGFEGGYAVTTLSAVFNSEEAFEFAIHHQGILAEVGKFLGMQDIVTGYLEFDNKVIVKSNDAAKVTQLFAKDEVRKPFENLTDFTLEITNAAADSTNNTNKILLLTIDDVVVDTDAFFDVYIAFLDIVESLLQYSVAK